MFPLFTKAALLLGKLHRYAIFRKYLPYVGIEFFFPRLNIIIHLYCMRNSLLIHSAVGINGSNKQRVCLKVVIVY